MKRLPPPGSQWRLQYELQNRARTMVKLRSKDHETCHGLEDSEVTPGRAVFDEIVIHPFLHCGQMDRTGWWIRVCNRCFWVYVGKDGKARIAYEETRDEL